MEIQGHVHNGLIVPQSSVSLPEGTEVTITVRTPPQADSNSMSDENQESYRSALARIDSLLNENPGDEASGADHDRLLYGTGQ